MTNVGRMMKHAPVLPCFLASILLVGGCAGGEGETFFSAAPGQNPDVSGENVFLAPEGEETYFSALGERCARIRGEDGGRTVCLRNGTWVVVPPVAPPMPAAGGAR
jgi:hypothetical protein